MSSTHVPQIFLHAGEDVKNIPEKLKGADGIELDLRMSKDNVVVVRHDRRIQNGDARYHWIDTMRASEIQSILGRDFVSFESVVKSLDTATKRHPFTLDLDLKQPGMEKEIKKILVNYPHFKVLACSPEIWTLKLFEDAFPHTTVGLSYYPQDKWDLWENRVFRYFSVLVQFSLKPFLFRLIRRKTRKGDIEVASIHHKLLNAKVVDFLHQYSIKVHTWGTESEKRFHELVQLGVDGIKTKKPELLKKTVEKNYEDNRRPSTP